MVCARPRPENANAMAHVSNAMEYFDIPYLHCQVTALVILPMNILVKGKEEKIEMKIPLKKCLFYGRPRIKRMDF